MLCGKSECQGTKSWNSSDKIRRPVAICIHHIYKGWLEMSLFNLSTPLFYCGPACVCVCVCVCVCTRMRTPARVFEMCAFETLTHSFLQGRKVTVTSGNEEAAQTL